MMNIHRRQSSLLLLSFIAAFSLNISSEKVTLELYYETLCPYCSNFIVNYLPELFNSGLISAVDLKLYPYGNAKVTADGSIKCQHGEKECLLNTIEACAIDAWPELETYFPFIYCVEEKIFNRTFSQWETCFDKVGLERTPVDSCYGNGRGKELEIRYAKEIAALKPPHEYVPWVVVDGEPLYDEYESFMIYICEAYKGSSPPKACNNLSVIRNIQDSYKDNFSKSDKFYTNEYDTSVKVGKFGRSKMIHM